MEFSVFKTEGNLTQSYTDGSRSRTFPVSCANRTIGPWSAWSATAAYFGERRLMAGNVTPNFRARMGKGEWIPPNSFYSSTTSIKSIGMSDQVFTWHPPTCSAPTLLAWDEFQGRFMINRIGTPVVIGAISDSNSPIDLNTQVVTECLANRQKGDANYVESLAELDKLFVMLHSPLANITKFVVEFRRSRGYQRMDRLRRRRFPGVVRPSQLTKAQRRTKDGKDFITLFSSEYLRWRYGISPLIADVRAAFKALKTAYSSMKPSDYHTARASGSLQASKTDKYSLVNSVWTLRWEILRTETYSVNARWVDQYQRSVWTDLGLSWHNLIALPWELTRKSFVADWVVNIGDNIYAQLPRAWVTPKGGSYFTKRDIWNLAYFTGFSETDPTAVTISASLSDSVQTHHVEKRRQLIDPSRNIGLVIKSDFRLDQWTRALDAAAILSQQVLKVIF